MKSSTQVLSDSPRRVGTFRGLGEAEVDIPLSGGGGKKIGEGRRRRRLPNTKEKLVEGPRNSWQRENTEVRHWPFWTKGEAPLVWWEDVRTLLLIDPKRSHKTAVTKKKNNTPRWPELARHNWQKQFTRDSGKLPARVANGAYGLSGHRSAGVSGCHTPKPLHGYRSPPATAAAGDGKIMLSGSFFNCSAWARLCSRIAFTSES